MGKKIYADFTNGIAFYDTSIHKDIPKTAKEISPEIYNEYLNNQDTKMIDSKTLKIINASKLAQSSTQLYIQELLDFYKTLPLGIQLQFNFAKTAIMKYMQNGDYETTLQVIKTIYIPDELKDVKQKFADKLKSFMD